jgi:hypothetical protein
MKNLYLLVFSVIFFSSCSRMVVPMGKVPDAHPKPFVTLKSGTTVEPNTVKAKGGKIKTDVANYKANDVAAYSDGKQTFASVRGKSFAPKIFEGDLNIYQTSSTHTSTEFVGRSPSHPSGWHSSSHTHVHTYFQKAGTTELKYFSYRTLSTVITPNEPAFKYLQVYKAHRRTDNLIMAGGFALFIAGAAVLGSSVMSPTGKGEAAGGAMIVAGPAAMLTGFFMKGFNMLNLRRAVAKHNDLPVALN